LSTDYPQRMSDRYSAKVRRVAAKLRQVADDIERSATPPTDIHSLKANHARGAEDVIHKVMWGLANADLDGLVARARDADEAPGIAAEVDDSGPEGN
jgi:hypothetical protein